MSSTEERIINRWLDAKKSSARFSQKRRDLVEEKLWALSTVLTPEASVLNMYWFDSPESLPTPKNPGPVAGKARQLLKDIYNPNISKMLGKYTKTQRSAYYQIWDWYPERLRRDSNVFYGANYALPLMCLELAELNGGSYTTEIDRTVVPWILTLAEKAGWWYFENRAFYICDLPTTFKVDGSYNVHCATGPAVKWRDGYSFYIVEGRKVPKKIVTMKEEDPKFTDLYFNERNTEIRSVIMKKVGAARLLQNQKTQVLDRYHSSIGGKYELLTIQVRGLFRTYLKMENQSTGTYHMEAVPPECTAVADALSWRNGLTTLESRDNIYEPKVLT